MNILNLRYCVTACVALALGLLSLQVNGQGLKPGFNGLEYYELLKVSAHSERNPTYTDAYEVPAKFTKLYSSPVIGLDNTWDLWIDNQGTAIISIGGNTIHNDGWVNIFKAAMVSAQGSMVLDKSGNTFSYQLAPDPKAGVHAGWLTSMAFLSKDILPRIDSLHRSRTNNFLIIGHGQGGAIATLLTAHFMHLKSKKALPGEMRFKTYSSGAPKAGNLLFAYHYEQQTEGWSFTIANPHDWVPQAPLSLQTMDDLYSVHPFVNADGELKDGKLDDGSSLKQLHGNLGRAALEAQESQLKLQRQAVVDAIAKALPDLQLPEFINSSDYVRAGHMQILDPGEKYYNAFPLKSDNPFTHHQHSAYLAAHDSRGRFASRGNEITRLRDANELSAAEKRELLGKWTLRNAEGLNIDRATLGRTPSVTLLMDIRNDKFSGFMGCNDMNGSFSVSKGTITFSNIAGTRKHCEEGNIERPIIALFDSGPLEWRVDGNTLVISRSGKPMLQFLKSR